MKIHIITITKSVIILALFSFCCKREKITIENTSSYIAFDRSEENGNENIWLLHLATLNEIRIAGHPVYWEHTPVWLSDSELLFLIEPPLASCTETDIVLINLRTGKMKLLDYWSWEDSPKFGIISADVQRNIYYGVYEISAEDSGYSVINILSLISESPTPIPFISDIRLKNWGLRVAESPNISKDGTRFLFAGCDTFKYRTMYIQQNKRYTDIYNYYIPEKALKRLTFGDYDNDNPCWVSADSIIFSSNRNGNWDLFLMDTNGVILKQLTSTLEIDEDQGATVSPDHKAICYSGYDNIKKKGYIWLMNTETCETKLLTKGNNPAWSPAK
jgi:hypothetical protein